MCVIACKETGTYDETEDPTSSLLAVIVMNKHTSDKLALAAINVTGRMIKHDVAQTSS
jgi:hypothetical protein